MTITPQAVGRLALLGLLGGIVELTTVSQISIFGVPADLSPLLVASVGFLCGSVPGRCSASASACSSTPRCCRRWA